MRIHREQARGTALIIVFVISVLLLCMAMAVYTVTSNRVRGSMASEVAEKSLATAEAALALQVDAMRKGTYPTGTVTTNGVMGDMTYTIQATDLGNGDYKIIAVAPEASSIVDLGGGRYSITLANSSNVEWQKQGRAIEATVSGQTFHPFLNYAIFAGNKSNRAGYHFDFGGYKTYTYHTPSPTHTVSTTSTSYGSITATTPLPTPNPQVTTTVTSASTKTTSAMYVKQGPNSTGKYRWQITTTTDTVYNPVLDTTVDTRDNIQGDVYVHGDARFYSANQGTPQSGSVLQGGATVTGSHVDVTGSISQYNGTPVDPTPAPNAGDVQSNSTFVTGNANGNFGTVIPPPDLQGMGYDTMPDVVNVGALLGPGLTTTKTNSGIESGMNGTVTTASSSSSLASIFAKGILPTTETAMGNVAKDNVAPTNENYYFGDWWQSTSGESITITPAQNNKTYYVPGNLWMETNGYGPTIQTTDGSPVRITLVAAGNVYFGDHVLHSDYPTSASKSVSNSSYAWNATPNKDAIAIIAMASPEKGTLGQPGYVSSDSYTDVNNDGIWNPGEPILHADGSVEDTTAATPSDHYKGPREGTGNIFFGDPNVGPLGFVGAYLYAQNNFDDYALDLVSGNVQPQQISIYGTMSAGNEIRINRDFSNPNTGNLPYHAKMTVRYDNRLQNGTVKLPNLPQSSPGVTSGAVAILSWRELAVR